MCEWKNVVDVVVHETQFVVAHLNVMYSCVLNDMIKFEFKKRNASYYTLQNIHQILYNALIFVLHNLSCGFKILRDIHNKS